MGYASAAMTALYTGEIPLEQIRNEFSMKFGTMTDLGTLGDNSAFAESINEAGDVVGFQTIPGNDAVFQAALWSGGEILDIGALAPGGCSNATSINSHRQIVGITSSDCTFDQPGLRAIISDHGGPAIDLNTLIPANSGVELKNASIINDRGEIVAVAVFPDGNKAPVLLVPCESDSDQNESCQNSGTPLLATHPALVRPALPTASSWGHATATMEEKRLFGPIGRSKGGLERKR